MIIVYWNWVWWFGHVRCFPHPAPLRRLGTDHPSAGLLSWDPWHSKQTDVYIYIRNSQHYYFIHMIIHICWLCWLCWCWFACLSLISPGHFHDIENERKLDENDELCPGLPLVARGLSASIRAKMECWIGRRWSKSSKRWDICCFAASLKQG